MIPVPPAIAAPAAPLDRQILAMGTKLGMRLEGPASEAAIAEVARIEAACSTWKTESVWSRLNAAQGQALPIDDEWIRLLKAAKAWSRRTGGAFDPVLMALVRVWGLRGEVQAGSLAQARKASGAGLLILEGGTARLAHPEAGLEEGGFLKGYALDRAARAAQAVRSKGAAHGLLDFGGQLLAWGRPQVADIADPKDRGFPRIRIQLHNASLASSGTSERGRHILDPRTGEPCPAWGSVAVVAPTGLEADILSTALYVLGPEAGLAWAKAHGAAAAFLLNTGEIRLSPAFSALHPLIKETK